MTVRIITGDCRSVLANLPAESVHCCVTSPPYWGLRDYGIPPSVWGGDVSCIHEWGQGLRRHKGGPHGKGMMLEGGRSVVDAQASCKDIDSGSFCWRCGAWRGAFGLEPDYRLYLEHAVEVFREVHRVLRPDGTLWLNLGDSYTSTAQGTTNSPQPKGSRSNPEQWANLRPVTGLKPKDLCGIPWRVAFALQADGWWLRQDIIWSKQNPMPESVTDRCTKAHEYIFLMSKSARYYYDAEAIREAQSEGAFERFGNGKAPRQINSKSKGAVAGEVLANADYKARTPDAILPDGKRNKRSVWEIASAPFSEAHFATFPPALVEPCILAGCPKGGTVLDPFFGAGTTGLVADRLERSCIGIELNPSYAAMAERRIAADAPLMTQVEASA